MSDHDDTRSKDAEEDSVSNAGPKDRTVTTNTADHGSTVGIQGEHVINSTVYQIVNDASPKEKYEVGIRYLEGGSPSDARKWIGEAIAHGYDNGEVRFHWVLAMFSKRSYRDLTLVERGQLKHTSEHLHNYADDEWKRALQAICDLLDCLNDVTRDTGVALKELESLPAHQFAKIMRYLDLVLTGGVKDALWSQTRELAEHAQFGDDRLDRVWAYFHPEPIEPRVRRPISESTTTGDRLAVGTGSALLALAVGYLGWSITVHPAPLPLLACALGLAGAYVGARNGLDWRYQAARLKAKERAHHGRRNLDVDNRESFAAQVSRSFKHYFAKYLPTGVDRDRWSKDTNDIRNALRDEVVELYRDSKVDIGEVNWLIRHMVGDVRKRWQAGTLRQYREQYRTTVTTKVWCAGSLAVMTCSALFVVITAIRADPLPATAATLVALVGAKTAVTRWLDIICERRRFFEELEESEQALDERRAAHRRWKDKLDATRPSEGEMETWLNCDKMLVLDDALRHYRLVWRDVIAHAFLQTPAKRYKRARVKGGPWRYSRYDIRLFLITHDGVREVSTELDFEHASRHGEQRNNFRFDAVSSVHVAKTNELGYTLELTLMNGPTRDIRVTDPETRQLDAEENLVTFAKMNLDAAGFVHTLHILEGIAADGKGWILRDPHAVGESGEVESDVQDL